ncbi:hypothetical protein ABZ517_23120 [Streptomyces scabiei]|uniref:hypothetical protein n=1 Tax=Streptomyces scabiei TaxID=1930 RepID=UPI00340E6036
MVRMCHAPLQYAWAWNTEHRPDLSGVTVADTAGLAVWWWTRHVVPLYVVVP